MWCRRFNLPFGKASVVPSVIAACALVAACALIAACDQAPGPTSDAGEPPVLSDFSFSPHAYAVSADLDEENLTVPLSMDVTARDADGDVEDVRYVVQAPFSSEAPVAEGRLDPASESHYTGRTELVLPAGNIGVYTVLVYAVDRAGSLSNEVRGMLRIEGAGEPPVVESVAVPDTVRRPGIGEPAERVAFVAVVSDPEGLSNVNRVEVWNVDRPAVRIEMFDSGEDGDEVAFDGRYTRIVEISAENEPGTNTFAFRATDLSGLESNVVEKTVVVE